MTLVQLRRPRPPLAAEPTPSSPLDAGLSLVDPQARRVKYLRVSLTDRCNFRCTYCMPEAGIHRQPRSELLTLEEIGLLVRAFARWGVERVRLTGGEPTVRQGLCDLVADLASMSLGAVSCPIYPSSEANQAAFIINNVGAKLVFVENAQQAAKIESIRLQLGPKMNLGDVAKKVVPKMSLIAPARAGGHVCTRTFIPHDCHAAIGVLDEVSRNLDRPPVDAGDDVRIDAIFIVPGRLPRHMANVWQG